MKTVLIVEDEKMIRQGIKVMVQRSGVPVEVIIECNNGETALDVIREQKVDVMFTDIRMPKMDGIELVRRMQECEHIPLTVAISGYDDFSYAVEMLRTGVREYLLKPVERQKIKEVLEKLEQELVERKQKNVENKKIGYQQMKYFLQNEESTPQELELMEKQYGSVFYQSSYYVCCSRPQLFEAMEKEGKIMLPDVNGFDVYLVPEPELDSLLATELAGSKVGVSGPHVGLSQLRQAFGEAIAMRKEAFLCSLECRRYEQETPKIPERLLEEARKLTGQEAVSQRVQLLGTRKTEELKRSFQFFFEEAAKGRIAPELFWQDMIQFYEETAETYRNSFGELAEELPQLKMIWNLEDLSEYQQKAEPWILALHEKISSHYDNNRSEQKMQQAVKYMEDHYAEDLNMAVVSNYVSMNYSLFSFSFKQYTGTNFVNYLKNIRLEQAKKLLVETDWKVLEISQKTGYDNEKHFMKVFKATLGVSPSEYRKNMRG